MTNNIEIYTLFTVFMCYFMAVRTNAANWTSWFCNVLAKWLFHTKSLPTPGLHASLPPPSLPHIVIRATLLRALENPSSAKNLVLVLCLYGECRRSTSQKRKRVYDPVEILRHRLIGIPFTPRLASLFVHVKFSVNTRRYRRRTQDESNTNNNNVEAAR